MRMGQQHEINRRQIFYQHPGTPLAAQQNQPFREDRIDQHLSPVHLQQKGGVPDKGDSQFISGYQLDGMRNSRHRTLMALSHQPPELPNLFHCKRPVSPYSTHLSHQ